MNVRVSQDEHQEGKRAEVSSDSSIKTTSTLLNAEHQSANCTAIAKAEPSTSKISEVNNATLSPEDAATVRAYVDRFDCMGPFTAGPAPLIQIRALMLGQCGSGMSCLAARVRIHEAF